MPVDILMPALSPTMEKGNLARWLKNEGDSVKSGDILAEIETDKALMEVEAVDEGILAKILVPGGSADIPVNQPIAVIALEGEDPKSVTTSPSKESSAPAQMSTPSQAIKTDTPIILPPQSIAPASASKTQETTRIFASPLARRLAKEKGINLASIKGTGPHNRIVERDVLSARPNAHGGLQAPGFSPSDSDTAIKALFAPNSYTEVPHDNMRSTIARRLTQSKQNVPHFYLTMDCDIDFLLALRTQMNEAAPQQDGKPMFKLSVNDFIIKAYAMALAKVPEANVSWTEAAMLKHNQVDLGVAVAIPGGLMTPILRDANNKSLSALSQEMKDLAARARTRRLKPQEYQGGSAALSNLGMYGVKDFAAIINPPQASILAVGAGEPRVVVKNGQPAVATIMSATLSVDHRAIDGAVGAELMQAFKNFIEKPVTMLV